MKSKSTRILSVVVALTLLTSAFTACGSSEVKPDVAGTTTSNSTTAAASNAETLKTVELQMYCIGDEPKDLQVIQDKLNEMTKKDLNATVKLNFTSWTDYSTKYNLILSTGQPVDLIYTANWLDFAKLARKGAFQPLDELLTKYGPDIKSSISDELWNQVKLNDKIYTMPANWAEYSNLGFQYRKDLQKKYNLPEPNSLENVEKYFDGIKQNVPKQDLVNVVVLPGVNTMSFTAFTVLGLKYKWCSTAAMYGMVSDYETPYDIKNYWASDDFVTDMKMFKKWADKGYWSKSALSAKTDTTLFDNGKTIAIMEGQNANKYGASVNSAKTAHPDWEIGYVNYPDVNGVATVAHATQNGTAIPTSSTNPERAMMFYQKLLLDKTYNQLTEYGIEGTHYKVTDGYYEGIGDPTKTGFGREGLNGWAWRNTDFMLFPKAFDVVKEIFAKDATIAAKTKYKGANILAGFQEDYTSYQTERAALGTVLTQYLAPLEAGLVPDVDKAIATFREKAKAAGLEKIQAEYTKQWQAYCEQYNYK